MTGGAPQAGSAGVRSGLAGLEEILSGIEGLAFVHLGQADVVRDRIVRDIVSAYERVDATAKER